MIPPIPLELVESVQSGDVVAFCGAGLSALGGLPTGSQLARALASRLDDFDGNPDDLTEVSTTYSALRGRHALLSFLLDRVEHVPAAPTGTHRTLCGQPFAAFVSTNWDHFIEQSLSSLGIAHSVVVTDSELPFVRSGSVPVLKIHGTLTRPDTIVVTDRDYYDLFSAQPGIASVLNGYFATKTLLFLGYGLNDPDFKRLYYTLGRRFGPLQRRAYAIQLRPAATAVSVWREQRLDVIDRDAKEFAAELARATGLPS
ncbi:SIR2 family protein [Streptosporangium sp. NPDC050280]|uniref:SIR2 family protein n=1 Tax=unclassified Streptosporangium TaxID=2632669 RepID=UPI003424B3DE